MIRLPGRTILTTVLIASAAALSTPSYAAPVITFLGFYTDRYAPNSVPNFATGVIGNHTQWDVQLISSDPANAVNVIATRPGGVQFNLFFLGSPIFANYLFSRRSVLFSEQGLLAFAASSPPWGFVATDTSGPLSGFFPTIAEPELLPFASDVQASDHGATPTITWSLPNLSGFDVDRVRLRAIDATSGLQIFQAFLAADATSFTLPEGVLLAGHSYYYRVILEDLNNGLIENRSNAFSAAATTVMTVPEPETLGLISIALLAGALGIRRRPR
jgi:PEP-CTERM motif